MSGARARLAIRVLHWTVGLVVLLESVRTFHAAYSNLQAAGHAATLNSVRMVLSGAEIVAAVLFVLPVTTIVGGYALLVIFALAIVIHALHGQFGGLEVLVLYGVAVFVCLADKQNAATQDAG